MTLASPAKADRAAITVATTADMLRRHVIWFFGLGSVGSRELGDPAQIALT